MEPRCLVVAASNSAASESDRGASAGMGMLWGGQLGFTSWATTASNACSAISRISSSVRS
jgi:hypothetical protein